jgi:hypothetical protein
MRTVGENHVRFSCNLSRNFDCAFGEFWWHCLFESIDTPCFGAWNTHGDLRRRISVLKNGAAICARVQGYREANVTRYGESRSRRRAGRLLQHSHARRRAVVAIRSVLLCNGTI